MRKKLFSAIAWQTPMFAIVMVLAGTQALAQHVSIARPDDGAVGGNTGLVAPVTSSPVVTNRAPEAPSHRRFWDNENRVLFATVAALSAADFAVTRANLRNGGRELNPVTRIFSGSTAGLAVNFAGETAGIIGLSYYFHKTGHHRLERLTPMFNIGMSSFAVAYDLSHR